MTGTSLATDTGAGARVQMTRAGFERMRAELDALRTIQRPEVLTRMQRATLYLDPTLGQGVASSVRYELGLLDQQIAHLEAILQHAEVIDPPADTSMVQLGLPVTVRYQDGSEETLTVVGPPEAIPGGGDISMESPVGRALLGKPVGAKVKAEDGSDSVELTVVSIEKAPAGGAQ